MLLGTAQLRAQTAGAPDVTADESEAEVLPPQPVHTPLAYPEDATGESSVLLELVIGKEGEVTSVQVLEGESPFREAALLAASTWRFRAASRQGRPLAARVRYSARFIPPASEPAPLVVEPSEKADAAGNVNPASPAGTPPSRPLEITVEGERRAPGAVRLTRRETRALPGSFGDPLRAIEAQPGVVPIVSGLPAFFIRGAPPANVGFFFDGVDIPLLYHAFFGPSVVHPSFIRSVELHAGAAPVQYGRFAGPIVAVEGEPLQCRAAGEANVRLIDAGGSIESGPFAAGDECGSSGVRAAGRYSYAGLVLSLLSDAKLSYWDYQLQAGYAVGKRDVLSVLAFGGYDLFRAPQAAERSGAELAFHRVDLRWDRRLDGGTMRLAVTGGADRAAGADPESSVVTDRSLRVRAELNQRLASRTTLSVGLDGRADRYGLDADRTNLDYPDYTRLFPARTDVTAGAYVGLQLEPAPGIRVAPGLRGDLYASRGTTKLGVDPRVAATFVLSERLRVQQSLGVAHQRPGFTAQVPGAQVADLESGLQWALLWSSGLELELPADLRAAVTVYRAGYFNAMDPIGGARDFTIDRSALDRRANLSAAGLELQLRRPVTKQLGGLLSYTLSRSDHKRGDYEAPSGFDRTHVLQAALSYEISPGFRAGARSVLYSGVPELNLEGSPRFSSRRRGTPFFRLDLRAEKRFRLGQRGYWALIGEILNATSTREVIRLDCGEVCRERSAGPVILPSVGVEAGF